MDPKSEILYAYKGPPFAVSYVQRKVMCCTWFSFRNQLYLRIVATSKSFQVCCLANFNNVPNCGAATVPIKMHN